MTRDGLAQHTRSGPRCPAVVTGTASAGWWEAVSKRRSEAWRLPAGHILGSPFLPHTTLERETLPLYPSGRNQVVRQKPGQHGKAVILQVKEEKKRKKPRPRPTQPAVTDPRPNPALSEEGGARPGPGQRIAYQVTGGDGRSDSFPFACPLSLWTGWLVRACGDIVRETPCQNCVREQAHALGTHGSFQQVFIE